MNEHKSQQGVVHIGTNLFWPIGRWYPAGSSDAVEDGGVQRIDSGLGV